MIETWEFLGTVSLRLFVALICGAVVGFERKKRAKKAGIRTHCLVALGAAVFAVVSKYGFTDIIASGNDADIAEMKAFYMQLKKMERDSIDKALEYVLQLDPGRASARICRCRYPAERSPPCGWRGRSPSSSPASPRSCPCRRN